MAKRLERPAEVSWMRKGRKDDIEDFGLGQNRCPSEVKAKSILIGK
jgi:hypothetical protein